MIIKLEFPLPFKIPIIDGANTVGAYRVADFNLTFKQVKNYYCIEGEKSRHTYENTIVRVDYSANYEVKEDHGIKSIFHFAVINSIDFINHFIDALRYRNNLRKLNNFTIVDLPPTIKIEYAGNDYLYVTDPVDAVIDEFEADEENVIKALKLLSTWDSYPEIEVVDKFFDKGKYHLAKEQFVFAIVELQTSFEAFIRNTHRLILVQNGASDKDIKKATSFPFKNVIQQHLAKALNTELKFTNDGPIKDWYDNLYTIRNNIVHSGNVFVSGNQAYKAYDVYVHARNYITDLLIQVGYLPESGKVNLKTFTKNTREDIDYDTIHKRLVDKGILPSDLVIRI